jgi:hypothetical protein
MSQTKVLVIVAGAALSTGVALAQNANLDQSRAYQNELIADAGTRASLLQGGPIGGDLRRHVQHRGRLGQQPPELRRYGNLPVQRELP